MWRFPFSDGRRRRHKHGTHFHISLPPHVDVIYKTVAYTKTLFLALFFFLLPDDDVRGAHDCGDFSEKANYKLEVVSEEWMESHVEARLLLSHDETLFGASQDYPMLQLSAFNCNVSVDAVFKT